MGVPRLNKDTLYQRKKERTVPLSYDTLFHREANAYIKDNLAREKKAREDRTTMPNKPGEGNLRAWPRGEGYWSPYPESSFKKKKKK